MKPLSQRTKAELVYMATHRCKHRHLLIEHPQCMVEKSEKIGFLDIEANGLQADFGIMLSWAIKEAGGEIHHDHITKEDIEKAKPGQEDKRLVASLVKELSRYDRIITHYGNDFRYDVPFIRTRAVAMRIPFPHYGTLKHSDTFPILKKKFRLSRNRQETAARTLIGHTEKDHLDGATWRAAARGNAKAIKYIVNHNLKDVRDLERLWNAISPYVKIGGTSF